MFRFKLPKHELIKKTMSDFKLIKKFTKKWSSGYTVLAIIGDNEHKDRNYIILERKFIGSPQKNQRFNLHLNDWENLKNLIDGEAQTNHEWPNATKITDGQIGILLSKDPDFLAKILSNKNISNLSSASFEALDKIGLRVYEIKVENVDFLLNKFAGAGKDEIENFISVLGELKIGQISTLAELIRKKISILKLLERLLEEKTTKEVEIHKLLGNNLWLLNNDYDLVKSNSTLATYLNKNIKEDPDLGKRPDLIVKYLLQNPHHSIIVELKRPNVKLNAEHIGQVLSYKGIAENHNPELKLDLYLIGYDRDSNMPKDLTDVKVEVLENIINKKNREFNEYLKVLEEVKNDNLETKI